MHEKKKIASQAQGKKNIMKIAQARNDAIEVEPFHETIDAMCPKNKFS